jgi:molybdenum cofactor guanylyltransferase
VTGPPAISGIVLAGGASRRFGGDKLAEPIDGVALLDLAIQSLIGVVDEIVVVVAPGRALPRLEPPPGLGAPRFAVDPERFGGPLVGIRTGLDVAVGSTVVVIGGDMPAIVPAVLALLIGAAPAALADDAGVLRPLPCALDRQAALVEAERLLAGGERRLRALLAALGTAALPRPTWAALDPSAQTLVDIDERADLADRQRGPDHSIEAPREEEPGP